MKSGQGQSKLGASEKIVRTCCRACHMACGVLVRVRDGEVVGIEGDPHHPTNEGMMCPKGLSYAQVLYHPDRIKYPVRRAGERGSGKWQRISWDEALDTVASEFKRITNKYGPESLAFTFGMVPRGGISGYHMLYHALGSPNVCCNDAHYCNSPSQIAQYVTVGLTPKFVSDTGVDFKNSNCMLIWGANPVAAQPARAKEILTARARGAKLIVVDPRFTNLAAKADIWLQIRPGTDDALALGFLNVIINNELYDKGFVNKWCVGFEKLRERVQQYPLGKVSEITWVPAEQIVKAATIYATTKPAVLKPRVAVDQTFNGVQAVRAFVILIAITGNIDVKGGNVFAADRPGLWSWGGPPLRGSARCLPAEVQEKRIGAREFPLLCGPQAFRPFPHPPSLIHAMLTDKPYPVKGLFAVSNLLLALEGARETAEALKRLEFHVHADFFMTPTAELADIVLAPATWLERDEVLGDPGFSYLNWIAAAPKAIEPLYECWDEMEIVLELAKRMGIKLPENPAQTVEEFNDFRLKGMGITFNDLKEKGYMFLPLKYKKYEQAGFKTPSGKVELYSSEFEQFGYDPLPNAVEPPESPYSAPELAKEYPLILTAGRRHIAYWHSMGRQIPWLRELAPDPLVEIHPETAERLGIKDGDWIWIETPRGGGQRIKQRAKLTLGLHPRVVQPEAQWWFPEMPAPEHGCWESNINAIISNDPPYGPVAGAVPLRSLLCRIYKVEEK